MDMTESIIPRSDQVNADDLIAGPITYTIRDVIVGKAEHPFDFLLVETDRAYRPSKTMRRVIVGAWGSKTPDYAGRRLTLYREPSIMFGGQKVGGIRISHMSDISAPVVVMAQTTRGKRETFTVQPLATAGAGREPAPVDTTSTGEGGERVSAGESPASANRGAAEDDAAASPDAPDELLLDSITRQIAEITEEGGGAHLKTWWASIGIGSSKRALIDRFGEDCRNIRQLMGPVT